MIAIERASDPARQRAGPASGLRGLAHCAMPASPEAARQLRRLARAVARRWRLSDHLDEALSVIVTELVTNVVMHSGSPWVSTVITVREDSVTVEVMDGGCWKDRLDRRQEPLDANVPCGRGLRLVDAYAHRTVAHRTDTGSVVLAEIPIRPGRPEGASRSGYSSATAVADDPEGDGPVDPDLGLDPALDPDLDLEMAETLETDDDLSPDEFEGLVDVDVEAELELEELDRDMDMDLDLGMRP